MTARVFFDTNLLVYAVEQSERSSCHAAILVAADALGAHTVYSEDLNHGQRYGQVQVVNPFR
jgi:predicted nucleic acid-binding protein